MGMLIPQHSLKCVSILLMQAVSAQVNVKLSGAASFSFGYSQCNFEGVLRLQSAQADAHPFQGSHGRLRSNIYMRSKTLEQF